MDKSQWKDIIWPVWKKPYKGAFWRNIIFSLPYSLVSGFILFPLIYSPVMPVGEEIMLNFRYTGNLSTIPNPTLSEAFWRTIVLTVIIYLSLVILGYRGFFDCPTPENNKTAKKIWDEICETSLMWEPTGNAVQNGWCSSGEKTDRIIAANYIRRAQLPIRIIQCNVPLSRVPNLQELIQEALNQYEAQKQAQAQVIPQTQVQTPPPVSSDQLR